MKQKVKPTFDIVKSPKKPYTCYVCGNAFAWGKDSWQYGKPEYETKAKEKEDRKLFCSKKCRNEFERQKDTLK